MYARSDPGRFCFLVYLTSWLYLGQALSGWVAKAELAAPCVFCRRVFWMHVLGFVILGHCSLNGSWLGCLRPAVRGNGEQIEVTLRCAATSKNACKRARRIWTKQYATVHKVATRSFCSIANAKTRWPQRGWCCARRNGCVSKMQHIQDCLHLLTPTLQTSVLILHLENDQSFKF